MGELYDAVAKINDVIEIRGLNSAEVRGELSLKSGFFLAIVFPDTPDDPEKLAKLRAAARELLQVDL